MGSEAKKREIAQLKKEIREVKAAKKKNEQKLVPKKESNVIPKKRDSLMMSQDNVINLNEKSNKTMPKKGDIVVEKSNYNLVEFQDPHESNSANPDENFKIGKLEDIDLSFVEYE